MTPVPWDNGMADLCRVFHSAHVMEWVNSFFEVGTGIRQARVSDRLSCSRREGCTWLDDQSQTPSRRGDGTHTVRTQFDVYDDRGV